MRIARVVPVVLLAVIGGCDARPDRPAIGTLEAGVVKIAVTSTTYTPRSASCASPCASTNQFLVSVFGPAGPATRNDYAFFFHYVSNDPLVYHEWKNASCNRGGNHGDIQSTPGAAIELPTWPVMPVIKTRAFFNIESP